MAEMLIETAGFAQWSLTARRMKLHVTNMLIREVGCNRRRIYPTMK